MLIRTTVFFVARHAALLLILTRPIFAAKLSPEAINNLNSVTTHPLTDDQQDKLHQLIKDIVDPLSRFKNYNSRYLTSHIDYTKKVQQFTRIGMDVKNRYLRVQRQQINRIMLAIKDIKAGKIRDFEENLRRMREPMSVLYWRRFGYGVRFVRSRLTAGGNNQNLTGFKKLIAGRAGLALLEDLQCWKLANEALGELLKFLGLERTPEDVSQRSMHGGDVLNDFITATKSFSKSPPHPFPVLDVLEKMISIMTPIHEITRDQLKQFTVLSPIPPITRDIDIWVEDSSGEETDVEGSSGKTLKKITVISQDVGERTNMFNQLSYALIAGNLTLFETALRRSRAWDTTIKEANIWYWANEKTKERATEKTDKRQLAHAQTAWEVDTERLRMIKKHFHELKETLKVDADIWEV